MSKKENQYKKVDQTVRRSIAADLSKLNTALKSLFGDTFISSPIDDAVRDLPLYSEEGKWGYEISDMRIPIDFTRHLKPDNLKIENCSLYISVKVKGSTKAWNNQEFSEYFDELNFDASLVSLENFDDFEYKAQFHIDKVRQDDTSNEMHPRFHVHYSNESGVEGSSEKRSINSDLPRLAHHPVELILGTILVIANYNNPKFQELKEDGIWNGLSRKYVKKIVYPYYKELINIIEKQVKESDLIPYLTI